MTNASPPGAGRSLDVWLSLLEGATISTASRGASYFGRQLGVGSGTQFTNAGAAGTKVFQTGRLGNNYVPGTGDATIFGAGADHYIAAPPFDSSGEEVGAIRMIVTMKVTGLPAVFPSASGAASDFGWMFYGNSNLAGMSNTQSSNPVNANAGFGFACNAAGEPVFVSRSTFASAGLPDEITVVKAGGDLTQWNTFDVRFAAATPTSRATLTLVLNGESVLTRTWITNAALPTAATIGANYLGVFRPIIGTASGSGVTSLQVSFIRVIKGPTFSSLF